jgi:hypothetical protein
MVKIDSAVTESVEPKTNVVHMLGERGARSINDGWKGDFVADATTAGFQYGLLVAGRMLPQDRAEFLLRFHFDDKKVEPDYWSAVWQSFLCGRDSGITHAELRERMSPAAASNTVFFEPTPFKWRDPSTIPLRDWIYGKHLLRRHVSATIASGAVGKSSLKIVEALALATGRPLLGIEVPKRARVWLFNLEDEQDEMDRRLMAAMIHYRIKGEDVEGYLFVESETSLVITVTDRNGTKIRVPVVGGLIDAVKRRAVDALTIDPFISSHDSAENDNGAMDLIVKQGWIPVAREGKCAIDICHHITKSDTTSGMATAMSARGGGSFIAACRSVQVLNPMTPDEASKAGLPSEVGYFSSYGDKQNLTPKTKLRDWYKFEDISLGNNAGKGNLAELKSDKVGVITSWQYPTDASFTEDVTGDQLQAIKNWLKIGEHRKDNQASDWAGYKVGEVLGLGASKAAMKPHDRKRITLMLNAWVKEGHFKEYTATVDRQRRQCLRTA